MKNKESVFNNVINEAYIACMNHTATDEQELIWRLANAVHCAKARSMTNDNERAYQILCENDFM